MKKHDAIRAVVLAALVAAPFAPVAAAAFEVRRATTAAAVSAAPPLATIATSPYDDGPTLVVGGSYYYAIYDGSGGVLDISVQAIPALQAIRIGFDDSNAASAPVDASASTVALAPPSIQANGVQTTSITVVPRDANGELLGRGLAVTVDASLLWPATLSGPVVDHRDGSYEAQAVAWVPGTGSVRVDVEGVILAPLPTITATAIDTSSLRDLAIAQLQGLAAPGGPLSSLLAQAGAGTQQGQRIAAAMTAANQALATLVNDDFAHDDNVVKTTLDAVLNRLAYVLESPGALDPLDVRDTMDDLVGVARLIAEWHLERAIASCGVCNARGNPKKVCDANSAMTSADAMRAAISPDWRVTVDEYAWAIELSLQAVQSC